MTSSYHLFLVVLWAEELFTDYKSGAVHQSKCQWFSQEIAEKKVRNRILKCTKAQDKTIPPWKDVWSCCTPA